ncbi:MAG: hypothetical protein HY918_03455 [Candidatus Doudnabacteria bacterium]|nr:hypothetical protein [Candidatus Doudnabacteria bacterium]
MDKDKKLEKQINEFQSLGKENPKIDVGMLMLNALQSQKQNEVPAKTKRWAYLISIGAPPFGILFAVKYFFSDEDDARQVAWSCVVLTVLALLMWWVFAKLLFSGSGTSLQQVEQIKPSDIMQLTQ